MASIKIKSDDLARVCVNAVAFLPARAKVQHARITIGDNCFEVTATDTYTIGRDWCRGESDGDATLYVDRDALQELDRLGRSDKKGYCVVSDGDDGHALLVTLSDGTTQSAYEAWAPTDESVLLKETYHESNERMVLKNFYPELWQRVDELMTRMEGMDHTADLPRVIALDPTLLMRFSKVKADKGDRIMDCLFYGPKHPVLVRIGPTFTGAIMPIDRETQLANERAGGEEGLWSE